MSMSTSKPARLVLIPVFVALVGAVAFIAARFRPGDWYDALQKPPWTPPDWVFAPVWTVLYLTIAVAGWLIFVRTRTPAGRWLWSVQLALNGIWSWLFFGLHRTGLALADLTLLLGCIAALLFHLARRDRTAFYLLAPYGLWVAYAWTLNAGIVLQHS